MCSCFCVFQRRRSAEDELAMRGFLQEGDLISVSCTFCSFLQGCSRACTLSGQGNSALQGLSPALLLLGLFSIAQYDALGFVTCEGPMVFPFLL